MFPIVAMNIGLRNLELRCQRAMIFLLRELQRIPEHHNSDAGVDTVDHR